MQFDLFYHVVRKFNKRRNIIMFGCGTLILLSTIMIYSESAMGDTQLITQNMSDTPKSATNYGHLQISEQNNWSTYPEIAQGKGTYDEPYIIDGVTFDANYLKFSLKISNTQDYMIFRNCVFNGSYNGDSGSFIIDSCSNIDIISCEIINNEQTGLFIKDSQNITVFQTTIEYNSDTGISCSNSSNITFESNIIEATDGIGILIESNSHNIEILKNGIGYNEIGIKIMSSSSYVNVTENDFDGNSNYHVILVQSSFNSIIGNTLSENDGNEIIDESNDETNTIRDNSITYLLGEFYLEQDYMLLVYYGLIIGIVITAVIIGRIRKRKRSANKQKINVNRIKDFCPHCGEILPKIPHKEISNQPRVNYCEHCGEKIL
ncbi:hypothetical protein NEF87_001255 [Candidatus Lokiarchaeum ossiferum]|uniref:Right handed beta helix domain-containing protein n=1 Tax=Candidatus Lokiarchaeum ossiferum TaxID=2951803 RepID=A0ABY6HN74_9ARCH|nr:hypothetical protein NEF87_001255 [Candidatus Lokiarchaeum sp. B-35]